MVPNGVGNVRLLPARDKGYDDVGGVAVEVLAAPVVDRGGTRIRMAGGDLHVAKWDTCVEGGHDERGSQHVRVDQPEPGSLANGTNPAVSSAPVEALTVATAQDRALAAFTDRQIDGPRCAEARAG